MTDVTLHQRYAPILHFARDERFFPMDARDFVSYSALHLKGQDQPAVARGRVRPEDLLKSSADETFLRSVERGPLAGMEVAGSWSRETLALIQRWAQRPTFVWSAEMAERLYDWFSPKTAEATQRFWWNPLLWGMQRLGAGSATDANQPRFSLPSMVRDQALASYRQAVGDRLKPTYYYRMVPDGAHLVLQYWFFYAYNDWAQSFDGFNDHEGDWEGVQLFFALDGERPVEPPAFVCYQGHHSRITKPWDHPDVAREGQHMRVFVAGGSHASYPEPKRYSIMSWLNLVDDAAGDGRTIGADDWQGRICLDDAPWMTGYRGSWGTRYWLSLNPLVRMAAASLSSAGLALPRETSLPGVSAPRGPQYDDGGAPREVWERPVIFAGVP